MGPFGMGMRQEHDVQLSQQMGMAMLSLDDITRIVAETSPLRQVKVNKVDIDRYLISVNGMLVEQKLPQEKIRGNYLTALAIHTFAAPVMGLEVDAAARATFVNLARKRYDIADPLNVYFQPAVIDDPDDAGAKDVTGEVARGLVDVGHSVQTKRFKATTHVQKGIGELANDALARIRQHGHSYSRHFRFSAAYEVCVPLFGADVDNNDLRQTHAKLRDAHGYFQLQGPE